MSQEGVDAQMIVDQAEFLAWKARKATKAAEAMERAARESRTWAQRVRETYKKACEFDLTELVEGIEGRFENKAHDRELSVTVHHRDLPGIATIGDVLKALQVKHPDAKFKAETNPEIRASVIFLEFSE